MVTSLGSRPVIFGEVLFDHFENGESVLGGAPFNVAYNLKGFGQNPLLISRVGDDENGFKVIESMKKWGMDISGITIDKNHPTGSVEVNIKDGQPEFSILPDQAYDFIDEDAVLKSIEGVDISIFYHGSLALRGDVSRKALEALENIVSAPFFVDVNLRTPWWDKESVSEAITGADFVKLNDEELLLLCDGGAESFRKRVKIGSLLVTKGARGAELFTKEEVLEKTPDPIENIIDTVGAGDAFSSVMIVGYINCWEPEKILERAVQFSSSICGIRGAVCDDVSFYEKMTQS